MHSSVRLRRILSASTAVAVSVLLIAGAAQAQDVATPPPKPAEPELNIINLPTTRSLPRHQSYFRLTHRFARDLRRGSFGQLAEDLFSLDNGAIIGLEYRFGITDALQAGVHRSLLSRTIQVFSRYDAWRQGDSIPVSISFLGSVEGLDNLTDNVQPGIAATISRIAGSHVVLYATPAFVARTRAADFLSGHDHGVDGTDEHANHEHTFFVGLGGRLRVGGSAYLAGEYSPRVAGHDPGRGTWGAAFEKKTGGHTFQVNFTNSFGTTFGQLARGGSEHDIYLGFNITRLF
jgi:Membrane bound beta barrel domain (DUF5777)